MIDFQIEKAKAARNAANDIATLASRNAITPTHETIEMLARIVVGLSDVVLELCAEAKMREERDKKLRVSSRNVLAASEHPIGE